MEVLGAENVPQRGLREEARRVVRVLDVGHGDGGVGDAVVDHGVDGHGHRVFGQDLRGRQKKLNE